MKLSRNSADGRLRRRIRLIVWGVAALSVIGLVVLALSTLSPDTSLIVAAALIPLGAVSVTWVGRWSSGVAFVAAAAIVGYVVTSSLLPVVLAAVNLIVVAGVAFARTQVDKYDANRIRLARQQRDLSDALDIAYRQVRYESALSAFARSFIAGSDTADRHESLDELMGAIDADSIIIGTNKLGDTGEYFEAAYSLSVDGSVPIPEDWTLTWAQVPDLARALSAGKDAQLRTHGVSPGISPESLAVLAPLFPSMLAVPLIVEGVWSGAILIGERSGSRTWLSREVALVWSVANMIGAAFRREATLRNLKMAVEARDTALQAQSALTDSSRILLEGDEENAFERALGVMLKVSGAAAAFLQDVVPDHPELADTTHVAHRSGTATIEIPDRQILLPEALEVFRSRQPWIVEDRDALTPEAQALMTEHSPGVVSELRLPIVLDGTMVGVVGLADPEPHRFSGTEVQLVSSIASMLAAYVRRSRAQQDLEGLVQAKDRFIATVSHELRTPMSVILGLSTELATRRSDFTDAEADEFTDLISRQSREVSNIIEDLLVSARAAETSLTVQPSLMYLDEITLSVLHDLPAEHTWRIVQVTTDRTPVVADELRVRQIIRNLVVNSHRYGGDEVFIRVTHVDDTAVVAVTDSGQQIPDAHRAMMFEAYATAQEFHGRPAAIGLGLTVSRQLANLMSGDVTYHYTGLSEFQLTLPRASALVDVGALSDASPPTDGHLSL